MYCIQIYKKLLQFYVVDQKNFTFRCRYVSEVETIFRNNWNLVGTDVVN
jgi:hypothetical protein